MEMPISGVSGLAVEPEPRRGLPALPTNRTAEPRSTRDFRFLTAIGDLRRSREEFADLARKRVRQDRKTVRFLDYLTVKTSQASRSPTLWRRGKGHYNRIDATRNKRFAEKTKKFRHSRSHAPRYLFPTAHLRHRTIYVPQRMALMRKRDRELYHSRVHKDRRSPKSCPNCCAR